MCTRKAGGTEDDISLMALGRACRAWPHPRNGSGDTGVRLIGYRLRPAYLGACRLGWRYKGRKTVGTLRNKSSWQIGGHCMRVTDKTAEDYCDVHVAQASRGKTGCRVAAWLMEQAWPENPPRTFLQTSPSPPPPWGLAARIRRRGRLFWLGR